METENTEIVADLHNVAGRIRQLFIENKRKDSEKAYHPHPRFDRNEIWMAAAENCIECKADPYSFVRAAFRYCSIPGGPFPNNMCGKAAVKWFEAYKHLNSQVMKTGETDVFKAEVRAIIRSGMVAAITAQRTHKRPRDFLLADFGGEGLVSAFVRCILMPTDELILAKWGKLATSQILGSQRLLTVLQELKCDLSFLERFRR